MIMKSSIKERKEMARKQKVVLEKINLKSGVSYTTLVEGWEDVSMLSARGVDFYGREVATVEIRCSDGKVRTYSPEQIAEMRRDNGMNFKTNDGYRIDVDSVIRYTGDRANSDGTFIVTKIEITKYGMEATLTEETGDERKFVVSSSSFNTGAGRRFLPIELVTKIRKEKLQAFIARS